jgi:hypothetical protein
MSYDEDKSDDDELETEYAHRAYDAVHRFKAAVFGTCWSQESSATRCE